MENGTLFEDPQFIPGTVELGVDLTDIKWQRPHVSKQIQIPIKLSSWEISKLFFPLSMFMISCLNAWERNYKFVLQEIVENPHFALSGKKKYDINQGELGDCWFLAALADISQDEDLINFIVPTGQSCTENYAGIFHFR